MFVKPARAGSSSGVMMVDHWDELDHAIIKARDFDPKVVVEAGARGKRELECAVMQQPDGTPIASVVGEITVEETSSHEFYDFEAKYLDGTSVNIVPGRHPGDVERAHPHLRGAGVRGDRLRRARARRLLRHALDGLIINEINTMPGSPRSRCSRCCGRPAACRTRSWSTD